MALDGGGGTALSTLYPYHQNTHFTLIGGGIGGDYVGTDPAPHTPQLSSVLPGGIMDYLGAALEAGNPYATAVPYDPTDELQSLDDAVAAYASMLSSLDPQTDFTSYLATAITGVDSVMDSTYIDDAVDAFETRTAPQFARAINRLTGPMAMIGAVNSSAFIIGMGLLERQRLADLADRTAQLEATESNQRAILAHQFMAEIITMANRNIEHARSLADAKGNAAKVRMIAKKEHLAEDLELDYKDLTYELELFGYGSAVLAAGLGAPQRPVGPSKAATALASTITTAATVASVASPLGLPLAGLLAGGAGLATWMANS